MALGEVAMAASNASRSAESAAAGPTETIAEASAALRANSRLEIPAFCRRDSFLSWFTVDSQKNFASAVEATEWFAEGQSQAIARADKVPLPPLA